MKGRLMDIRIRDRHAVISIAMVFSPAMGVLCTINRDRTDRARTGSTSRSPSTYLLPTISLTE